MCLFVCLSMSWDVYNRADRPQPPTKEQVVARQAITPEEAAELQKEESGVLGGVTLSMQEGGHAARAMSQAAHHLTRNNKPAAEQQQPGEAADYQHRSSFIRTGRRHQQEAAAAAEPEHAQQHTRYLTAEDLPSAFDLPDPDVENLSEEERSALRALQAHKQAHHAQHDLVQARHCCRGCFRLLLRIAAAAMFCCNPVCFSDHPSHRKPRARGNRHRGIKLFPCCAAALVHVTPVSASPDGYAVLYRRLQNHRNQA